MGRNKVLVIYTHPSTFVRGDIAILDKKFTTDKFHFKNVPKKILPFSLIKQFLHLLFNIYKYRLIYIWFADYHSFLPALISLIAGKKLMLVIGGYDICREKKWNYGSFSRPLRAFMTVSSIKMASDVLCVSRNIERTVKSIAPGSNTKLLYNGVNLPVFKADCSAGNQSFPVDCKASVLCVALVSTLQAFYIKGIDRFSHVASSIPECKFLLVGCNPVIFEKAGIIPPDNLEIIPPVPHRELLTYYTKSQVYCQLSRRESFSLSLAEAMSFNMVPVISTAGGMPEVTGNLGYQVYMSDSPKLSNQSLENAVNAVKDAISQKDHRSKEESSVYRQRILENFTLEKRSLELTCML